MLLHSKGAQHCEELVHDPQAPAMHACPLQLRQVLQPPPLEPPVSGAPPLSGGGEPESGQAPQMRFTQQVPVAQLESITQAPGGAPASAAAALHVPV